MSAADVVRIAVDIGGTFTDVVLEAPARQVAAKVLTTLDHPERGVLEGIGQALEKAGLAPGDVGLVIHGMTLATNAIIERKGAATALVTTAGFRDTLEIAFENRFDPYDVFIERPAPLIPRTRRFEVPERMDAAGRVRLELDEAAVEALVPALEAEGIESVAIGFLHSYVNPAHEERARDILQACLPGLSISLSSAVCPEAREYERFNTACANAFVRPLMARYLTALAAELAQRGFGCPLLLMTSGGGLTTLETAVEFPIRLVESGPAGGAILSAHVGRQLGLDSVLSFDMGGTTAKICLIDEGRPTTARGFEVARQDRFLPGSGLPLRIPVIEMVEIGAGGGSFAAVDELDRITVGPRSAGSDPGPACYGRGGTQPTVTDADLLLGRIDPAGFAGGSITLDPTRSASAVELAVGRPLGLSPILAASGISEIVEENMANAARIHAVERGADLTDRTLIAFGGAAPLHAARLAEKLGIRRVVVPRNAGVGSAVGFLRAPIAFELVRSRFMRLGAFVPEEANAVLSAMSAEARGVVARGAPGTAIEERRSAEMRYRGQGHEITIALPLQDFAAGDAARLRGLFEEAYAARFGRVIPGLDIEILSWTLTATAGAPAALEPASPSAATAMAAAGPGSTRGLFDLDGGGMRLLPVYERAALSPGVSLPGPLVITEAETTTLVGGGFDARIDPSGAIVMTARDRVARELAA